MLWYRGHEMSCFSAISDVRFFGRLGGTKQHFVEELEELDV